MPLEPRHLQVSRTARYFALDPAPAPVQELWICLHGYAQLAARFIRWLAPLDDGRTLVLAPEALSRFYLESKFDGSHGPAVGATWLTNEHRAADLEDHLGYLDRLLAQARADHGAELPLNLLGFSQGSALAVRWVASGRARPARLVLWGTPLPHDVPPAALAAGLGPAPVLLVAGDADPYATPNSIEAAAAHLVAAGARASARRFTGGHTMPAAELLHAAGRTGPA